MFTVRWDSEGKTWEKSFESEQLACKFLLDLYDECLIVGDLIYAD